MDSGRLLCAGFGRKCAQFEKILNKHNDSIKGNENTFFFFKYFHYVHHNLPKLID